MSELEKLEEKIASGVFTEDDLKKRKRLIREIMTERLYLVNGKDSMGNALNKM